MHTVILVFAVTVGVVLYFLPLFIASQRQHRNQTAIGILNVLAGWTMMGWIAALIWALYQEKDEPVLAAKLQQHAPQVRRPDGGPQPATWFVTCPTCMAELPISSPGKPIRCTCCQGLVSTKTARPA